MNILLFVPCYIDQLYPEVAISTVKVLERLGHKVDFDSRLVCCGQPAFNAGCWDEARHTARPVLARLASAEQVVVPSGSCAAMLRVFYRELFKGDAAALVIAEKVSKRVQEFSEFVSRQPNLDQLGSRFPAKVTFHDGCHGLRELQVGDAPRRLLRAVRGLELIELEDRTTCCGFGGTFAVKFPMISSAMGESKCAAAVATGADFLVSNDSSCLMHLEGMLRKQNKALKTMHLAEVLAAGW